MSTLLLITLVGVIFAFLATKNTQPVELNVLGNLLMMPLYLVALGTLLIGLLVSSIVHVADSFSNMFTIQNKNSKIKAGEKTVESLEKRIYNLELENAELRGQKGELIQKEKAIEKEHHPSLLSRIRHNLS